MPQIIAILCILTSISLLGFCDGSVHAAQTKEYWIDEGREVLAFIGDPSDLQVKPAKFKIAKTQKIRLIHKKSGPGVYAFDIKGVVILGENGRHHVIRVPGFIMVKAKYLRTTKYKKKESLKLKTKPKYEAMEEGI